MFSSQPSTAFTDFSKSRLPPRALNRVLRCFPQNDYRTENKHCYRIQPVSNPKCTYNLQSTQNNTIEKIASAEFRLDFPMLYGAVLYSFM